MVKKSKKFMVAVPFIHTPTLEQHILKADKTYIITSFTAASSHVNTAFQRLDVILRTHRVPYDIIDASTNPYGLKAARIWSFKRKKAAEAAAAGTPVQPDEIVVPERKIEGPHLPTKYLPLLYVRDRVIGTFDDVLSLNERGELKSILWPNGDPSLPASTKSAKPKTSKAAFTSVPVNVAAASTSQPSSSPAATGERSAAENAVAALGVAAAAVAAAKQTQAREQRLKELKEREQDRLLREEAEADATTAAAATEQNNDDGAEDAKHTPSIAKEPQTEAEPQTRTTQTTQTEAAQQPPSTGAADKDDPSPPREETQAPTSLPEEAATSAAEPNADILPSESTADSATAAKSTAPPQSTTTTTPTTPDEPEPAPPSPSGATADPTPPADAASPPTQKEDQIPIPHATTATAATADTSADAPAAITTTADSQEEAEKPGPEPPADETGSDPDPDPAALLPAPSDPAPPSSSSDPAVPNQDATATVATSAVRETPPVGEDTANPAPPSSTSPAVLTERSDAKINTEAVKPAPMPTQGIPSSGSENESATQQPSLKGGALAKSDALEQDQQRLAQGLQELNI